MEKEFLSYEIALTLKELGFDEPCLGCYYKDKTFAYHPDSDVFIDTPLYQQAFRWFRESYKLHQVILADEKGKYDIIVGKRISGSCLGQYDTYEKAELECLKKLIEIVKNEQNNKLVI